MAKYKQMYTTVKVKAQRHIRGEGGRLEIPKIVDGSFKVRFSSSAISAQVFLAQAIWNFKS